MADITLINIHIYDQYILIVLIGIIIGYWYVFKDTILQIFGRNYSWIDRIIILLIVMFMPVYAGHMITGIIGGSLGGYYGKHYYELWQHKNDIQALDNALNSEEERQE